MRNIRGSNLRRAVLAAAASLLLSASGLAQAAQGLFQDKMVTWLVPYPPGGTTDVLGRNIAQELAARLGARVVVDNRPGATGTIGAAQVARAKPDGLTLLGTSIGPQAIAPHLVKLPYDAIEAFAPVITVGTVPHLLVVGANQPFQSVQDLVKTGLAQPDALAYASGGNGTILQMQGELLQQQTGARFIHVPYKGDTPALQDTLSGQVQFMFAPVSAALPHVQSGRLRVLATTSAARLPALPDVPTMTELDFKDFVVEQWQAVFAPAGTPADIIHELNAAIEASLATAKVQDMAQKLGITLAGGTPDALDKLRRADFEKWGKVIRDAGITN